MINVCLAILLARQGGEMRLMRYPDVHGQTVVFTYAGDIWVADMGSDQARRLTSDPGNEVLPKISPDGTMVAFTGEYDGGSNVYVVPTSGGQPKRLSFDVEQDAVMGWTPDGRIAYTSAAGNFVSRQSRLWFVDPKGGLPQNCAIQEISTGTFFAGGDKVAYNRSPGYLMNWRRYRGGEQGVVSIYDLKTNAYSELPHKRENSWYPMAAGNSIFYVSDRNLGTLNLYRYDLDSKRDAQLTKFSDEDVRFPSTDGKTIVYERDGYLYDYDIASNTPKKLTFALPYDEPGSRPSIKHMEGSVTDLALSPSGVRIVLEARGELFSVPLRTGVTRDLTNTSGSRERSPSWAPDGKNLAYISDESGEFQVYTCGPEGEKPTKVSNHAGASINSVRWSPDSRMMTYTTQSSDLYTLDPATGQDKLVRHFDYNGPNDYDWSPDSKWIAFSAARSTGYGVIYLYDVAAGQAHQVTSGEYDDGSPRFDLNGKFLYFGSARTFRPTGGRFESSIKVEYADRIYMLPLAADTPNPLFPNDQEEGAATMDRRRMMPPGEAPQGPVSVKVDLDGMASRTIALPVAPGNLAFLEGSSDGVFYYMDTPAAEDSINKFDLRAKRPIPIVAGAGRGAPSFSADHTKLAIFSGGPTPSLQVLDLNQPGAPPMPVSLSGMEAKVDPRQEWKQIFWEAWRYERDHFYNKEMNGLDWKAIGDHYAQFLPYINNRPDLTYVLGLMIGELGTSHSYVNGPPPDFTARIPRVSGLGAEYAADGDFIKITRIYGGRSYDETLRSPLLEPGSNIKVGDYLLAVNGQRVDVHTPPNSLLADKAGELVTVTVNSRPSMDGSRDVVVRPTANEAGMRFEDWFEATAKKVDELSGGKIGYIYYPNTSAPGQASFIRGYYGQSDKDAVIMDDRWNSGGNVQPFVIPTLARSPYAVIVSRNSGNNPDMAAITGPKAMLINGYAGSGGDYTPFMFKKGKLGPLIGRRTWGGLVGINGTYPLMDGGGITSPEFGLYDPDTGKWVAENNGIEPDIDVDASPDLIAAGHDPQLEKAVQVLMDALKNQKAPLPHPAYPKVTGGGG